MTDPQDPRGEVPDVDLGRVAADDALLDALGRGEVPTGSDPVTSLLAAFRSDLEEQAAALDPVALAGADGVSEIAALPTLIPVPTVRGRPWTGRAAAVAVVGGVLLSGSGVAAALTAQPGDLLYGVRRAVVGPVDDSYHKNADALVDQTAKLAAGSHPISRAQQAQQLDTAAGWVPGIKDPGNKKATVKKIASARVALGLPSQPITTDGPPLATPGPTDLAAAPVPVPVGPTASPTPSPDGAAAATPSASGPTSSPSEEPVASASTPTDSGSPSPSASPTPRRRHKPSPSPSASPTTASPTYSYAPPPPSRPTRPAKPKPSPSPSPTFIIG